MRRSMRFDAAIAGAAAARIAPPAIPRSRCLRLRWWDGTALIPDHHQPVIAGLGAPGFPGASKHLAHRGAFEALELLARRIEAQNTVGGEIGEPDLVLVVDINRVAAGAD